MGLTATAQVRVKPRLLPWLPRLSTLGSEQCHQAWHGSLRSPLCSESGGRVNKRQVSLLVFIICIIIAPQCLVMDQNCILLALCKPRAKVLQSLPQRAYNLRFQTGGVVYKEMVGGKGSSDKMLITVTDSIGFLVRTISS